MTKSRLPSTGRTTGGSGFDDGGAGADPCSGDVLLLATGSDGSPAGWPPDGDTGVPPLPGMDHGDGMPPPGPAAPIGFCAVPGTPLSTAIPPKGRPGPAFTSGSAGGSFEAGIALGEPDHAGFPVRPGEFGRPGVSAGGEGGLNDGGTSGLPPSEPSTLGSVGAAKFGVDRFGVGSPGFGSDGVSRPGPLAVVFSAGLGEPGPEGAAPATSSLREKSSAHCWSMTS